MKTKFILHGGFHKGLPPENDAFYKEVLQDSPGSPKILLVYFAKEEDRIDANQKEDVAEFYKNRGNRNLSFTIATKENFPDQVTKADIVYLHGGDSLRLLKVLQKFPNLNKTFEGKVIAGDSAGANVLATFFFSHKANGVFPGLGLLPIKIICHYSPEFAGKLDGAQASLETLLLSEYQYRVFVDDKFF